MNRARIESFELKFLRACVRWQVANSQLILYKNNKMDHRQGFDARVNTLKNITDRRLDLFLRRFRALKRVREERRHNIQLSDTEDESSLSTVDSSD